MPYLKDMNAEHIMHMVALMVQKSAGDQEVDMCADVLVVLVQEKANEDHIMMSSSHWPVHCIAAAGLLDISMCSHSSLIAGTSV